MPSSSSSSSSSSSLSPPSATPSRLWELDELGVGTLRLCDVLMPMLLLLSVDDDEDDDDDDDAGAATAAVDDVNDAVGARMGEGAGGAASTA